MGYEVWIVEELSPRSRKAILEPSGFEAETLDSARAYADHFNLQELNESLGTWAVIRKSLEGEDAPSGEVAKK